MTARSTPKDDLGPDDRGLWVVTTESGTAYDWDLNTMKVRRRPSPAATRLARDDVAMEISRVEVWPALGQRAFFWVNDPARPWAIEYWVITSAVVTITWTNDAS